jgi:hypothetical protein
MTFMYHAVPLQMVGEGALPTPPARVADSSRLRVTAQEVRGSRSRPGSPITSSGVRFNDTLHRAPIHPYRLYEARRRLNLLPTTNGTHRGERPFFMIPVERIRAHASFWYRWITPWIKGYSEETVAAKRPLDEFEPSVGTAS